MDVWIKSPVDVLITDEISHWGIKLWPLMVTGMTPLCLGGILREISLLQYYVATHVLCCKLNTVLPCVWITVYLNPNYMIESISSVYLWQIKYLGQVAYHMAKVWENLKLAMQKCKTTLPSEEIDDPSAVLRCSAAGSILVL